ncbi:carbohydrate kinase family protein [Paenibacillus sp. 2TAB19]|uniref:carbohydrate kinase family protein n=1 Tax=Paenibacillus sp. 2TAB19 TaxID=3233003 RepID=UPI003F9D5009
MSRFSVPYRVIVGGHVCLDIIPAVHGGDFKIVPGKLIEVGQAVVATGGAVANTGIALHRLGVPIQLMGKIGDDILGEAILGIFRKENQDLTRGMIIAEGESTAYSIVLSPPNRDRMFLHCTGANDTFNSSNVTTDALVNAGLFHFGYPPLMQHMYTNNGSELCLMMRKVKEAGLTTSLDLAKPDPYSAAGKLNWSRILTEVLPHVDLFLPSIEEILFMLRRERYEEMLQEYGTEGLVSHVDTQLLEEISTELLNMGTGVVILKLGKFGLYMRTTSHVSRLGNMELYGPVNQEVWLDRELYTPCFQVAVAGTTGAGDCTIAGFLAGIIQGLRPEESLIGAVATGAHNVEQPDATSGIPSWKKVMERIAAGWPQHEPNPYLTDFVSFNIDDVFVFFGPNDRLGSATRR